MSKVFRLYREGTTTYEGWNENPAFPYNTTARGTIDDPDGASAKNEITSIPSPFARIDLVKTAFREVCNRASRNITELDGKTIFHKMVSDTLDVGEIFFNIDKYKDKIEIITWDSSVELNALKADNNPGHFYVADALEKYMDSDAKTYNFGQLKNIYLLNYKNGPDELNIIGATSPATLFFSNANKLDYVNDVYFSNEDKPFDSDFQPLYKRDYEYIKSWWVLRKMIPNFTILFPEIETYLNLTYKAIRDLSFKNILNTLTVSSISDFGTIDVQSYQQVNQVEVLGVNILKKKNEIKGDCEFTVKADNDVDGVIPIVLPVEAGNKYSNLQYVNGEWGKSNKAPYKSSIDDIEERCLPFDGSKFPFLTISDFLEDTIVKVPHVLNKKYYYNGDIDMKDEMASYLLPIKPLYFKYFTIDTLTGKMSDGKKAFEMENVAGGSIRVTIRIPINGNKSISYIEYQRIYYTQHQADVNETNNSGGMASFDFTGIIMPSVRFRNSIEAYYTVACVSAFSTKFRFEFFDGNQIINGIEMDCRNQEEQYSHKAETYTIKQRNFDFIKVSNGAGLCGLLVPCFPIHQGLDTFDFAVDLGTSNTHIEYKKSGAAQSIVLEYTDSDSLNSTFFTPTFMDVNGLKLQRDLMIENSLMSADFIPNSIGKDTDYFFPTRTVLSYAKCTDWTQRLRPFGLVNFNMTYNKRDSRGLEYNAKPSFVNIKWSNESNSQAAMQAFIKNVMLMIRNVVVANNGDISKTSITWFYPNSMSHHKLGQFRTAWNEAYNEFFSNNGITKCISESVAPIQYYFRRYATATNLVNIDIGGGTTDVAFSSGGKVDYITSFRFATNALFEDSFSDINPNNGIIDYFKQDILRLFDAGSELYNIYNDNIGHPSEMASFLFSLKDNSATKDLAANSVDFNKILQNDTKFKLVFIIFYTAIIYHVAEIVKEKGLSAPRHISFSGNGSKIIKVISTDAKILSKYTKIVFEKVLGKEYSTPLDILGIDVDDNPKESTCKGGLISNTNTDADDNIKKLVMIDASGHFVGPNDTYASLDENKKEIILNSVRDFFNLMLKELPSVFNFDDNFGVEDCTFKLAKQESKKDLDTYLDKGIGISVKESGNINNQIEDSLSFYPIKGVIQSLSTVIKAYFTKE